jgi:hypothetical protein
MTSSTLDQIDSKMKSKILIPAIGLEQIQVLPFTTSNLKKAVLQDQEIEGPGWLVFSGFDISKLKTVDKHRYPIRVQVDNNTLVLKMVTKIHECMHGTLMGFIIGELAAMGLVSGLHYASTGSARYSHRLNPNSQKEADSSIGPAIPDPWPALVIEAGWSEGLSRLRIDAQWWLSAELPPNNPRLVVSQVILLKSLLKNS